MMTKHFPAPMKSPFPLSLVPILLLIGCAADPAPSPPVPDFTFDEPPQLPMEFASVRRADEWHYQPPQANWTVILNERRHDRSRLVLESDKHENGAYRLTEEAWFEGEPEERLNKAIESLQATLRSTGEPFGWQVLSESPGDVTLAWTGKLGDVEAPGQLELRRFKIGNHGVYSLAFTVPVEAFPFEKREQLRVDWARILQEARLEAYVRKHFAVTVDYFEITDPEIVKAARDHERQQRAKHHRHEAALPYFEELASSLEPLSTKRFVMKERDRSEAEVSADGLQSLHHGSSTATDEVGVARHYALHVGFYQRHPRGVWISLRGREFNRWREWWPKKNKLGRFDYMDPSDLTSFQGLHPPSLYPEEPRLESSNAPWYGWHGLHPLHEPKLTWKIHQAEEARPARLQMIRTTVEPINAPRPQPDDL